MAIYQYLVTVETVDSGGFTLAQHNNLIQNEIDSNLEYEIESLNLHHFTVEPVKPRFYPGQGFVTADLSPDGRYND